MLLFGVTWTSGVWVRKAEVCFKHCFMSHPSRNIGYSGVKSYLNCGFLVSEEKNINMWPRNSSCDILVKNVVAFGP